MASSRERQGSGFGVEAGLPAAAITVNEFNNLLVGILGNARLLLTEGGLGREARGMVEQILGCAERAVNLVHSLDAPTAAVPHPRSVIREHAGGAPAPDFENVLVIDDEEIVRSVSKSLLGRAGFNVITAADGEEGLAIFQEHHRSLACVILDLSMPYMSGNLVYARLRSINPEIPVFLTSGHSNELVRQLFRNDVIAGFIQKPFQGEELVAAVRSVSRDEGQARYSQVMTSGQQSAGTPG